MKKLISIAALAAFLATSTGTGAIAEEKVLHVYNWSDYIAEDTIKKFEAKTGIKVTYDVYDSNEVLEAKLLAGSSGYDVVVPTSDFLQRQIAAGVYAKLDKSKLPNLKNMDPKLMTALAEFDKGNEYAVIYMWGTTGIGYNVKEVAKRLGGKAPTNSWDMIFDPANAAKMKDCGITMLDAPTELLPIAMNYLGIHPHSTKKADLEKGAALLTKIRPFVRYYNSSQYISDLANGDVCLSVGWSGDVFQSRSRAEEAKKGVEIGYTIPKRGSLQWFDTMAIPVDSKNKDAAHAFINFVMEAQITADITNYVWYANGNAASMPLVDQEIKDDPGIFPPKEVTAKLWGAKVYAKKTDRIVTRLWTKVKTGK